MTEYATLARMTGFNRSHNIQVSGRGRETVILANGYGTDQLFWSGLMPWLEQRFRVVRFDWPLDPGTFEFCNIHDIEAFVEDLLAVICATDAAPCTLIGHSMAAMVAMLAAKRKPAFFRQLVMLAPAPCYVRAEGYPAGFGAKDVDDLLRHMGDDYIAWVDAFAPKAVNEENGTEAVGEFVRSLKGLRPDTAFALARMIFRMDLRDRLDGFTIPTTIIQPTEDPAVPVDIGRYLARRWPHARLEIIPAKGHFPHLTATDQVLDVLESVLK